MRNEGPDPLSIRESLQKIWADEQLCNRYYVGYIWQQSHETWTKLVIDGVPVTDWHSSRNDAYAELADKIRAWEKENPELAIQEAISDQ